MSEQIPVVDLHPLRLGGEAGLQESRGRDRRGVPGHRLLLRPQPRVPACLSPTPSPKSRAFFASRLHEAKQAVWIETLGAQSRLRRPLSVEALDPVRGPRSQGGFQRRARTRAGQTREYKAGQPFAVSTSGRDLPGFRETLLRLLRSPLWHVEPRLAPRLRRDLGLPAVLRRPARPADGHVAPAALPASTPGRRAIGAGEHTDYGN